MSGCIDIHGHADATGSHLLCGWAPMGTADGLPGHRAITLQFENGVRAGEGLVAATLRDDLGDRGRGVALHLPESDASLGRLLSATIDTRAGPVRLLSTPGTEHVSNRTLMERMRQQRLAHGGIAAERFRMVLDRTSFDGRDTLDRLDGQVAFRIDEAVVNGGTGLLLSGWLLEAPGAVRAIRLRSGGRSTPLLLDQAIRLDRADVLAKHGDHLRSRQVRCGFLLPAADCLEPGEPCFVEIETMHGDIGYHAIRLSAQSGLAAIRAALSNLSPRYDQVAPIFDRLGPTLTALNADRLVSGRAGREIRFGQPPAAPVCSVIVPLYGRLDYMEVQVALLSRGAFAQQHELIYVVDDPAAAGAATHLADTLFRRFSVPIRLRLQDENLGFAPACNMGLAIAAGQTVCFLNSDVFGTTPDWLDRLVADLDHAPANEPQDGSHKAPETGRRIGIVGPLLLFEDGSVQHQGMDYAPLPEFGDWLFPTHPGKGERPVPTEGLVRQRAITGACMVMSRELARALGGFDEAFVIGDFEDSDLCLRARGLGVSCAVDHAVVLHHLERKSQITAAEPWRLNITLYNAWLHQKRWGRRLASETATVRNDA